MMKPGLGKGLGQLMKGDRVAAPAPKNAEIGRGLNTLIGPKEQAPSEAPPAASPKYLLPAWFFFAADILLLAYAVAITFDAPKPLDAGSIIFCAVSISLGAMLGVMGVLRNA